MSADVKRYRCGRCESEVSDPCDAFCARCSEWVIYCLAHGPSDHALWWKANGAGYTFDLDSAARFDEERARNIERGRRGADRAIRYVDALAVSRPCVLSDRLPAWTPIQPAEWHTEAAT